MAVIKDLFDEQVTPKSRVVSDLFTEPSQQISPPAPSIPPPQVGSRVVKDLFPTPKIPKIKGLKQPFLLGDAISATREGIVPQQAPISIPDQPQIVKQIPQLKTASPTEIKAKPRTEESKQQDAARLLNIQSIADVTGFPLEKVNAELESLQNNPAIVKALGFTKEATPVEVIEASLLPVVGAAFLSNPIGTAIGVGLFATINKLIPTDKLIPKDIPAEAQDLLKIVDLVVKGALTGGLIKGFQAKKARFAEKDLTKLVEDLKTEQKPNIIKQVKEKPQFKDAKDKEIELVVENLLEKLEAQVRSDPAIKKQIIDKQNIFKIFKEEIKSKKGEIPIGGKKPIKKSKVVPDLFKKEKIKGLIKKRVGEVDISKEIKTTEAKQLKQKLQQQAKGAKAGLKEGKATAKDVIAKEKLKATETKQKFKRDKELSLLKEDIKGRTKLKDLAGAKDQLLFKLKAKQVSIKDKKIELVKYANEQLALEDRGKLLAQVKNISSPKGLSRAMVMVDKIAEKAGRNEALGNLKKTIKGFSIKELRPEFQKEIKKLLDLDLKKVSERKTLSLQKTLKFIEENPDNNIPQEKLTELNRLSQLNVSELTTENIDNITQAVQHLVKLNKLKNKLKFRNKLVEAREITSEAVTNVKRKQSVERDPNIISTTEKPIEANKAQQIFSTQSYNMELISEILDKEATGIIKEVVYGGINDGTTKMLSIKQGAEDFLNERLGKIDVMNWSKKFHEKPGFFNRFRPLERVVDFQNIKLPSGKKLKITKAERVSMVLHSRNAKNLKHLLNGGFSFEDTKFVINKLISEDLSVILESATKEELIVADAIHEYFNVNQKDLLNKESVELNGFEVATEADYFPIRTNALDIKRDNLKLQKNFSQATLEGLGILKERTNAGNAIILEDAFSTFYRSVKQSAAYIGMAQPLRNAKFLVSDKEFRQTIAGTYGEHYVRSLDNYLRDIEGQSFDTSLINKITLDVINKMQVAVLGINPFVILKQPISYSLAATEMDIKYLAQATTPTPKEVIRKHSPQLRDRVDGNVNREVGEIGQAGESLKFWTNQSLLTQKFMKGIQEFDYQAIGRIWKAVEFETKDLFPELEGDAFFNRVSVRAEEVIRKTQPTFLHKDRSEIGRNRNPFVRLETTFSSQRNKNFMIARRTVEKYNVSPKGDEDKKKLFKSLALLGILAPLMLRAVDMLRDFLYGRKPPERPTENHVLRFLELNLGNIYFVGNLFTSFRSKVERGKFGGFDVQNLLQSTANETVNILVDLYDTIDQSISKEKYKSGKRKGELKYKTSAKSFVNNTLSVVSKVKGIPFQPVKGLLKIPNTLADKFEEFVSGKKTKRGKIKGLRSRSRKRRSRTRR